MGNVKHSSGTTSHFTPPEVVEAARTLMGGIDLDPASTKWANDLYIRAGHYFNYTKNGYIKPWFDRVLLNPPGGLCNWETGRPVEHVAHGTGSAKAWWFKLMREYISYNVLEAVFIGFSVELIQSTQVQGEDLMPTPIDFPCCFPSERLKFWTRQGNQLVEGKQPTHANVLVYLPDRHKESRDLFLETFEKFGRCIYPEEAVRS